MKISRGMEFLQLTGKVHIGWISGSWRKVNLCERYEYMFNFDAQILGTRYDNKTKICKVCVRLYKKGAYIPSGVTEYHGHGSHCIGGYGGRITNDR